MRHAKNERKTRNQKSMTHTQAEQQQAIETPRCPEVRFNKDLRAAIINRLKELKEMMLTEVEKGVMTMSHQIQNINFLKIAKQNHMEILELNTSN